MNAAFYPKSLEPGPMEGFLGYAILLEDMALSGCPDPSDSFAPALDGEAGRELRHRVDLEVRREFGAFFTGSAMAERLVQSMRTSFNYAWDPAIGGGDLILAAARTLPIKKTLEQTLRCWSRHLGGRDIHEPFIRAAKARLTLLARSRGGFTAPIQRRRYDSFFLGISLGNGLDVESLPAGTTVLMNPPYFQAAAKCDWARGKVNVAAMFLDHYVQCSPEGTQILAILPEVLRSGSNYAKLRGKVAARAKHLDLQSWGQFDQNADVDVFRLDLVTSAHQAGLTDWPAVGLRNSTTLATLFEVSVGAVVPHRHEEKGTLRRFLDARSAPSCGTVNRVQRRRRFRGTVVKPPFVTIKRTSRPGDKHRAVPTLVLGLGLVAVENHLIVCKPKDGRLETCHVLLERLQSASVSNWLDTTIRCRHLTVKAVQSIALDDIV